MPLVGRLLTHSSSDVGLAMVGISGASVDGATMVRGSPEKLCEHSRQRAAKSGFGV